MYVAVLVILQDEQTPYLLYTIHTLCQLLLLLSIIFIHCVRLYPIISSMNAIVKCDTVRNTHVW